LLRGWQRVGPQGEAMIRRTSTLLVLIAAVACGGSAKKEAAQPKGEVEAAKPEVKLCVDLAQVKAGQFEIGELAISTEVEEVAEEVWQAAMHEALGEDFEGKWVHAIDGGFAIVAADCSGGGVCAAKVLVFNTAGKTPELAKLVELKLADAEYEAIAFNPLLGDIDKNNEMELWIPYSIDSKPEAAVGPTTTETLVAYTLPDLEEIIAVQTAVLPGAGVAERCVTALFPADLNCDKIDDLLEVSVCATAMCFPEDDPFASHRPGAADAGAAEDAGEDGGDDDERDPECRGEEAQVTRTAHVFDKETGRFMVVKP
jgi:hypothetical protein